MQRSSPCDHYKRNCWIKSPCCQIFYGCRLCHDNLYTGPKGKCPVENMARKDIKEIKCLKCETEQEASNLCVNCETQFAHYYCENCHLYDDDKRKKIYHCDDCGICRIGQREETFHCQICNCCLSLLMKDNHKCRADNMQMNCPICMENLFNSRKTASILKCGHSIHSNCLKTYITTSTSGYKCPLCSASIIKMSAADIEAIDKAIEETKEELPEELKGKQVKILCNDCLQVTEDVLFHFYGMKCKHCGSYNTKE